MNHFSKITNTYLKTKYGKMPATRWLIRKYWNGERMAKQEIFTWTGRKWEPTPADKLTAKYKHEIGYCPAIWEA